MKVAPDLLDSGMRNIESATPMAFNKDNFMVTPRLSNRSSIIIPLVRLRLAGVGRSMQAQEGGLAIAGGGLRTAVSSQS